MRGIRQHVNPLGARYLEAVAEAIRPPAEMSAAPVDVELGCADAQFSFALAKRAPDRFVVGLEIRRPWVELNRGRSQDIRNLEFGYVNMNVDLDRVFEPRTVSRFFLLFPDPWWKARHRKRRVVDPELMRTISHLLVPGGELHFASDVFELGLAAMAEFESCEAHSLGFESVGEEWSFVRDNVVGVASRREETTLARGGRVWRAVYRVNDEASGSSSASSS